MIERVGAELGRIDILVNNAGINFRKAPDRLELEEWTEVIDTDLTSAFMCSKAVHPAMKQAGGGKVINIGLVHPSEVRDPPYGNHVSRTSEDRGTSKR